MSLPDAFHEIAERVNNWGRWGPDDEIGTLNLITDEVVRGAAACVRTGRRVPLALPLRQDGVQCCWTCRARWAPNDWPGTTR